MAIIGTLPNQLQNGTTADASQVMADFNFIVNQVNANAVQIGTPQTGQLINVTSFAVSGTYTPNANMKTCIAWVEGAAGGGGGTAATGAGQLAIGAGGGSGALGVARITASQIGASQTVTIGAAGAFGGPNGNGGAGGQTSLGALVVAPGGPGGAVGPALAPPFLQAPTAGAAAPTFSGAGTTALYATGGNPSTLGVATSLATGAVSGGGGHSPLTGGGGGRGVFTGNAGTTSTSVGAGGGGGSLGASAAATTGGPGGAGYVLIYEYA